MGGFDRAGGLLDWVNWYYDKLKVTNMDEAKANVLPIVQDIISEVYRIDPRFEMTCEARGSVYEKLKVGGADEFDFDLKLKKLEMEQLSRLYEGEFTVFNTPGWDEFKDRNNEKILTKKLILKFAEYVHDACQKIQARRQCGTFRLTTKLNHPAITVKMEIGDKTYDVDLAIVIEVQNWPENLTQGWETRRKHGFPSDDCVSKIKAGPICLVAKPPKFDVCKCGSLCCCECKDTLWRLSFSHAEKQLALDPNSVVPNSCRRPALRVLKGFKEEYSWPFLRSYHLKTLLFYEFESHKPSEWAREKLGERVHSALLRLRDFVTTRHCPHYFLPEVNLFKLMSPAHKEELLKHINNLLGELLSTMRKLDQKIDFYLRRTNGKLQQLSLKGTDLIETLEQKAADIEGLQKSQFYLSFQSRKIETGTIESNGITSGSTVEVMARLRGGSSII